MFACSTPAVADLCFNGGSCAGTADGACACPAGFTHDKSYFHDLNWYAAHASASRSQV